MKPTRCISMLLQFVYRRRKAFKVLIKIARALDILFSRWTARYSSTLLEYPITPPIQRSLLAKTTTRPGGNGTFRFFTVVYYDRYRIRDLLHCSQRQLFTNMGQACSGFMKYHSYFFFHTSHVGCFSPARSSVSSALAASTAEITFEKAFPSPSFPPLVWHSFGFCLGPLSSYVKQGQYYMQGYGIR